MPIESATQVVHNTLVSVGDTLLVIDADTTRDDLPADERVSDSLAHEVVGVSYAAQRLRRALATVATAQGSILILGDTGTGKEVAASAIHRLSGRGGPFVPVNCAAIPADLAEAELFGCVKGAFTGADRDREGYLARSSTGTLFLDELGELPGPVQAKLLRVLEDQRVQPLGSADMLTLDLRVVAATNAALDPGAFRRDLLARIGDWELRLGSLRERRADVLPLWHHFLAEAGWRSPARHSTRFAEALLLHTWPMNARDLRKLSRRMVTLGASQDTWELEDLPADVRAGALRRASEGPPDRSTLEAILGRHGGNVSKAAAELGCDRRQVYRWMSRMALKAEDFR